MTNTGRDFFFFFWVFQGLHLQHVEAHGRSQARGQIGAVASGLHHNHSITRSEPHRQLTPQLMAMSDP